MNLKNFLLLTATLLAAACQKEDATKTILPTDLQLSLSEVELAPGAAATVRITVAPADAEVAAEDFSVVAAESGDAPAHVVVQSVRQAAEGAFDLMLRDNRTSKKYVENLEVRCAAEGCAPASLVVRSAVYMPVVYVTTQTQQNQITKDTWVEGRISIDGGNRFEDLPEMVTQVKGRGNSTWGWEKKPYALKLDKKQPVLGMPKHKRWCLIANYMDRTHLRNRVAYHIGAHSKLAYTPRNEYVELYFNGAYQGLYLLTEQIKVDENRVNIPEMGPEDNAGDALTGGYLLEFDTNYDEDRKFRSAATDIPVNIKSPDAEDMTDEQFAYIRDYVNRADAAVRNNADPFSYIDMESMVDFWIAFEVMANHEILHPKSIYFHKDRGSKLIAGPIWDFDYETLVVHTQTQWINYNLSYAWNEFPWYENNWWNRLLLNNASFRAAVKARWQEWYPFLLTVPEFMDAERKTIVEAVGRNNERWPQINTGHPNRDETLSFDDAVKRLKQVYATRLDWMNRQISAW